MLERRFLLNREVQSSDDAVRSVELSRNAAVAALGLRLEITNGATVGGEEIFDAIDRIEVRGDGSDILFSLTGPELHRWQWIWNRKRPNVIRSQRAGGVQEAFLLIPFGRGQRDKELWLPTGRWNRVEARIDFSPTISATTFATGTVTISLIEYTWADMLSGAAHAGFLRTRQIRDFTSLASGETVIELDRMNPYTGLLVFAREAGIADGTDITIVELREDAGRVIPFTGNWLDWQQENHDMLGIDGEEHAIFLQTDNANLDMLTGRILAASLNLEDDTGAADATHPLGAIASLTGDRIVTSVVEVDEAGTQADSSLSSARFPLHVIARGIGIGNAVYLPLANPGDIDNPYNAPGKDKVELVLTNGGAGAVVRVSTQELVRAA